MKKCAGFQWKILLIFSLLISLPISVSSTQAGMVTFAWDAGVEEDLAGYKIYYGNTSRTDPALRKTLTRRPAVCDEPGVTCRPCPPENPVCTSANYAYENVVDVGNVTEYALKDLADGIWFFAIVAYDKNRNESEYSVELTHEIDGTGPDIVLNFSSQLKEKTTYTVIVEEIEQQP